MMIYVCLLVYFVYDFLSLMKPVECRPMSTSRSKISVAGWSFGSADSVGSNRPLKKC